MPGAVALLLRDRVATLDEMADAAHYFYATPHPDAAGDRRARHRRQPAGARRICCANSPPSTWTREAIWRALKAAAARHGLKPPQVMMPLRVLVCGTPQTPAIDAVLALLGRDAHARARLERRRWPARRRSAATRLG